MRSRLISPPSWVCIQSHTRFKERKRKNDYPLREISITDFNTPISHPFRFPPYEIGWCSFEFSFIFRGENERYLGLSTNSIFHARRRRTRRRKMKISYFFSWRGRERERKMSPRTLHFQKRKKSRSFQARRMGGTNLYLETFQKSLERPGFPRHFSWSAFFDQELHLLGFTMHGKIDRDHIPREGGDLLAWRYEGEEAIG